MEYVNFEKARKDGFLEIRKEVVFKNNQKKVTNLRPIITFLEKEYDLMAIRSEEDFFEIFEDMATRAKHVVVHEIENFFFEKQYFSVAGGAVTKAEYEKLKVAYRSWNLVICYTFMMYYFSVFNGHFKVRPIYGVAGGGKSTTIEGKVPGWESEPVWTMVSLGADAAKDANGVTYQNAFTSSVGLRCVDEAFLASFTYLAISTYYNKLKGVDFIDIFGDPNQGLGGGNFSGKFSWITAKVLGAMKEAARHLNNSHRLSGVNGQLVLDLIYSDPERPWVQLGMKRPFAVGKGNLQLGYFVEGSKNGLIPCSSEISCNLYLTLEKQDSPYQNVNSQTCRAAQGKTVSTCVYDGVNEKSGMSAIGLTRATDALYVRKDVYEAIVPQSSRKDLSPNLWSSTDTICGVTKCLEFFEMEKTNRRFVQLDAIRWKSGKVAKEKYKNIFTALKVHFPKIRILELTANPAQQSEANSSLDACQELGIDMPFYDNIFMPGHGTQPGIRKDSLTQLKSLINPQTDILFLDAPTMPSPKNADYMIMDSDYLDYLYKTLGCKFVYKTNENTGHGRQVIFEMASIACKNECYWLYEGEGGKNVGFPRHNAGKICLWNFIQVPRAFNVQQDRFIEVWQVNSFGEHNHTTMLCIETKNFTNLPNNRMLIKELIEDDTKATALISHDKLSFKFINTYHEHAGEIKPSKQDLALYRSNPYYWSGYHVIRQIGSEFTNTETFALNEKGELIEDLNKMKLYTCEKDWPIFKNKTDYTVGLTHHDWDDFEIHPRLSIPLKKIQHVVPKINLKKILRDEQTDFHETSQARWLLPFGHIPGVAFSSSANTDETKMIGFLNRLLKCPMANHPGMEWFYVTEMAKMYDHMEKLGWLAPHHTEGKLTRKEWIQLKDPGRRVQLERKKDFLPKCRNQTENFGKVEKQVGFVSTNPRMIASMNPENLVALGPDVNHIAALGLHENRLKDLPCQQTDGMVGEEVAEKIISKGLNNPGDGASYDGGQSPALTYFHVKIYIRKMGGLIEIEMICYWPWKKLLATIRIYFNGKMLSGATITLNCNSVTTECMQLLAFWLVYALNFATFVLKFFRALSNGDDAGNNGKTLKLDEIEYNFLWTFTSSRMGVSYLTEDLGNERMNYNSGVPMKDQEGQWYMQALSIERSLKSLFVQTVNYNPNMKDKDIIRRVGKKVITRNQVASQLYSEKFRGDSVPIKRAYLKWMNSMIEENHNRSFRRHVSKCIRAMEYNVLNATQHEPDRESLNAYLDDRYGITLEQCEELERKIINGEDISLEPRWHDILLKEEHPDKHGFGLKLFGIEGTTMKQNHIILT